jgi:hypothetical protein
MSWVEPAGAKSPALWVRRTEKAERGGRKEQQDVHKGESWFFGWFLLS